MKGFEGYEIDITAGCLQSDEILIKVSTSELDPDRFSSPVHGWFFEQCRAYYKQYKKRPSVKTMCVMIQELQADERTKTSYLEVMESLLDRDCSSADYSTDRLTIYMKRQKFLEVLQETTRVVAQSDTMDEAYTTLFSHIVRDRKEDRFKISDYFGEWQDRKIERLDWQGRPRGIMTGYTNIDRASDGMKPGELWAILAKTAIGKSISLVNIGTTYLQSGDTNLLHISTENPLFQVSGRYDSRITGHPYKSIQKWEVVKEEEDFMDSKIIELARGRSRFRLVKCPPQSTSTLVIWEIMTLLEFEGFIPGLIIIDSLEHIAPVTKFRESRFRFSYPFWEMKSLLIDKEIAGITSCQAKQKANSDNLKIEDMSEAYDKSRVLDGLVALERKDGLDLKETGFGRFKLLKNRDGIPWAKDEIFFDGNRMSIQPISYDIPIEE